MTFPISDHQRNSLNVLKATLQGNQNYLDNVVFAHAVKFGNMTLEEAKTPEVNALGEFLKKASSASHDIKRAVEHLQEALDVEVEAP